LPKADAGRAALKATSAQERRTRTWRSASFDNMAPFDYAVLFICLVIVPSGVIHGLVSLDSRYFFAAFAPMIIIGAIIRSRGVVLKNSIPYLLFFTVLGSVASAIAQSFSQILMGTTFALAIIAGKQLCETLNKPKALALATNFTLALLVLGLIGLLYF